MVLSRQAKQAKTPVTRTASVSLDFDGLPSIAGGKRFWAEVIEAIQDKVCDGIDADYIGEYQAETDVKGEVLAMCEHIRIAIAEEMAELRRRSASIRNGLRRRSGGGSSLGGPSRRAVTEAFASFGLDRRATLAEAKSRFVNHVKHYHPDSNPHVDREHFEAGVKAMKVLREHFRQRASRETLDTE